MITFLSRDENGNICLLIGTFWLYLANPDPHRHNIGMKSPDIAGNIWRFPVDRNSNRYPFESSKSRAQRLANDRANRSVKHDMVDVFSLTKEPVFKLRLTLGRSVTWLMCYQVHRNKYYLHTSIVH